MVDKPANGGSWAFAALWRFSSFFSILGCMNLEKYIRLFHHPALTLNVGFVLGRSLILVTTASDVRIRAAGEHGDDAAEIWRSLADRRDIPLRQSGCQLQLIIATTNWAVGEAA